MGPGHPCASRTSSPSRTRQRGRTGRGQLPRDQRRGRRHPVRLVRQPAVVQGHLPRVQQPGCAVPVADYQRRASHRARGRRALPLRHTGRHQDAQALQRAARFAQGREGGARVHGLPPTPPDGSPPGVFEHIAGMDDADVPLHTGDLSYADGFPPRWTPSAWRRWSWTVVFLFVAATTT